ncbi:MAG: phosphatase PAP2 family protein, partial [Actinomycetota bacterium]
VDTLVDPGGLWSFESGTMETISNQYAAMPSLHIAWAIWCTVALYPVLRRGWAKAMIAAYPVLTMFAIVVTANHYWLDAVGGVVALVMGIKIAPRLTRLMPGPAGTLASDVARRPERA